MKRRILLVDDDVAVLLTMKAVLEISGFDVDTAASAREGKHKLKQHEYHMIITDMRMESEGSGREVITAARSANYHPAVALLTAFPIEQDDWQGMGADKMLVKPCTRASCSSRSRSLWLLTSRSLRSGALRRPTPRPARRAPPKRRPTTWLAQIQCLQKPQKASRRRKVQPKRRRRLQRKRLRPRRPSELSANGCPRGHF
jgi:DNA-binding response OmpR family regulator